MLHVLVDSHNNYATELVYIYMTVHVHGHTLIVVKGLIKY